MNTGKHHQLYTRSTEKHSAGRKFIDIPLLLLLATFLSACIYNNLQPLKKSKPHVLNSTTRKDAPLHFLLSSLQLTERDLSIDAPPKKYDSFQLEKVAALLQNPLQIPSYGNYLRKRIGDSTPSLEKLLHLALDELELESREMDNQVIPTPFLIDTTDNLFPHIDNRARDAMLAYISAATSAQLTMNEALSELTPAERAFLGHYFSKMILMDKIVFSEATKPQGPVPPPAPLKRDEHYTLQLSFHLASRIDRVKLLSPSLSIAAAIETLIDNRDVLGKVASQNSFQETTGLRGDIIAYEETPYGAIIIGGKEATYYNSITPLLIIDLGGDDEYHNIAHVSINQPATVSSTTIIDFAGNDIYRSDSQFNQGSAGFGFSCLVDLAGNDTYLSRDFSQGCGFFGVGILFDRKGNDRYRSDVMGQGAAAFGIGLLCDLEGNDSYFGNLYNQGVGFVGGMGLLIDREGNDVFVAGEKYPDFREPANAFDSFSQGFGLGYRNYASGGIGVLWDNHGSDRYKSSYFSQGSSYWRAIGLLLDSAGSDTYEARRYAQGAGTHVTVGALIDSAGNDSYTSWAISQGCGYDYSQGMLLDKDGDDSYRAEWFSQGTSGASGVGMLFDEQGDDTYHCEGFNSQGSGQYSEKEESGSIGLLLDLQGKDFYSKKGKNNTLWRQGRYGGGMDARKAKFSTTKPLWVPDALIPKESALLPHTEPSMPTSTDPLSELEESIVNEEHRTQVVQELSGRGPSIIPQLLDYLILEDRQLELTVKDILLGMGKDALNPLLTILNDPAADSSITTFILSVVGEMEDGDTLSTFMTFLGAEDPEKRTMAMRGLSQLRELPPLDKVLRCVNDTTPAVRKYCARTLKGYEDPAAITALTEFLADDHFTVRFAAFESLQKTGSPAEPYLLQVLTDESTSPPYARDLAARLIEKLKQKQP